MKAPGKTSPSRGGSGGSEQAGGLDDETADGILGSTLAGMVCLGRTGQHDEGSVNSGACVEATGKPAMNGRAGTGPVGATEGGGLRGARISSPVDAEVSWQIEVHQNRFSSLAGAGELAAELGENHVELANPRSDSASVLSSDSQVKQREGGGLLPVPSHDWKQRRRHQGVIRWREDFVRIQWTEESKSKKYLFYPHVPRKYATKQHWPCSNRLCSLGAHENKVTAKSEECTGQ